MSMSGDEMRVPLRIDTSQIESDLRAVDAELARLERRMVQTFNKQRLTQAPATSAAEVRSFLSNAAYPVKLPAGLQADLRRLEQREQVLQRQAASGRGVLPPSERQEALARLKRVEDQNKPTPITAKQEFFDKLTQSMRRGAPNVVGMAAGQTGIPGASGLARMLMGLAGDNPLIAGGLGAAVAMGAGAIAVDAERARFQRTQASLAGAMVGGPAFGDTRTMMGLGLMAAAQQMSTSKEEGGAIAYQLASAGMRPGETVRNMQSVLGMTKGYGLQTKDVEPLVAALGTAGGMSANQIKQTLSDIVDASGKATGSIQQLTQGLGALSAVNARAGRDAFGLAAIQRAVGPTSGINAGQLMAPTMGATGAGALQAAALLGMSPEEFMRDQATPGGMARIYDRIAARARDFGSDATGTLIAEQVLGPGGMNLLNLPADASKQAAQIRRMQRARPGAAYADYQRRARAPRGRRPSPAKLIQDQTSAWDNFWLGFGNLFTQAANDPQHQGGPALSARSRALGMTGPVPTAPGGGGQFGLHTLSPSLLGQVRAAAGDVSHNVKIDVTVKDQRGRELGHAVDHTRVVAGARTALRPPHDRTGALDTPDAQQLPGRWEY